MIIYMLLSHSDYTFTVDASRTKKSRENRFLCAVGGDDDDQCDQMLE